MTSNRDRHRFSASQTEVEDLTVIDAEVVEEWPTVPMPAVEALDELDTVLDQANRPVDEPSAVGDRVHLGSDVYEVTTIETAPVSGEIEVYNDAYANDPFPVFTMTVIEEGWPDPDKMADALAICERIYHDTLGAIMHREFRFRWPETPKEVPPCQECGLDHRRGFMYLVPVRQS